MKKQFVTHEIALKLKQLGFDENCFGYYNKLGILKYLGQPEPLGYDIEEMCNSMINSNYYSAPLWQQTIDWLREKHNISISVVHYGIYGHAFSINFIDNRNFSINPEYNNMTYPKAREQAILKTLDLLNNDL